MSQHILLYLQAKSREHSSHHSHALNSSQSSFFVGIRVKRQLYPLFRTSDEIPVGISQLAVLRLKLEKSSFSQPYPLLPFLIYL